MKVFVFISTVALALTAYGLYNHHTEQPEMSAYALRLQDIANIVNSSNTTWKAGVNERWNNQSFDSVKNHFMADPMFMKRNVPNVMMKVFESEELGAAPESFDSRTNWPGCQSLKDVRDQSACGSCWAFGAAEVMSDRICIHSNQENQTRVSAEDLLECCTDCGNGCQGGYPPAAFQFWKNEGVVSGYLYKDTKYCKPYAFPPCAHHTENTTYPKCATEIYDTPVCSKKCENGQNYDEQKTKASDAYDVSGEEDIMTEISTNGPVEASFTVYEDFLTYKEGVYAHVTGENHGGHAVRMLGYGVDNGTKYWLLANSWNETWGDNGFFKMKRGTNECNIEESVSTGIPK